jgi:tetratricopeptide (TPR) repeat protein
MPRSSIRRKIPRLAITSLSVVIASAAVAQTSFRQPERFVDVVEVNDHDDQVDVAIQFNCSMRYVTHVPASEGSEVRVHLQPLPDCGVSPLSQITGETAPVSGGTGILSAARIDSDAPGQITLILDFKKNERFVLAQGVDPRGLRMRLIDRARGRGKILINQPTDDSNSNFAINLDSQPNPVDPATVAIAHERLKAPVFVSETVVEGQKWYRLRVGPIERRAEAERLLNLALPDYPRAWLAIGDDAITSDPNAAVAQPPLPPVERIGTDPPLDAAIVRDMMGQAKSAIAARDYGKAVTLLTKLQRQPEFPERAHAQELLGLARERSGQLAHAKAEYEEYLRRYPHGEAAERVALRLRILRLADAKSRTGSGGGGGPDLGWQINGGVAQLFRYDGLRVDNSSVAGIPTTPGTNVPSSVQTTSQDSLFNDVDFLARRRGENIDFLSRVSAGYAKNFASNGLGDTKRVSLASVEVIDRPLGLLARLGRQTRNEDGILGTFDGLFVSYQVRPAWSIRAGAGYPVEQTSDGPQTNRRFETLALAFTPPAAHWDVGMFAATEQFDGVRDRQAIGLEGRFLTQRTSVIAMVDYDTSFHSVNEATLLGTLQLPWRWNVSFDAERRNSPVLTTRNALIGQPVTTLTALEQVFTIQQIYQLARDRTPITDNYSFTATRPLGERFQFAATVAGTRTCATPASGGVEAVPATGLDLSYQTQIYGSSLWRPGDFSVVSLTYANTEIGKVEALSASSRFPLAGAWRIGPRLTVNRRTIVTDGSTEFTYVPSMLIDYQRDRRLLQLEFGGELGKRDTLLQTQNTKRYYVSMAYRISF